MSEKTSPFEIHFSDSDLADLQERLLRTRFTIPTTPNPWESGVDPKYLRDLVRYWRNGFDWRAREEELNAFPHFKTEIGDTTIHFIHVRGSGSSNTNSLPLLLTHGWPSSFVEMLALLPLLTQPEQHGADPADAFDVVIPSLPGFLFSSLPSESLTRPAIADLWDRLMTDVLGYERYGAYGGDIGASVTNFLGANHSDHIVGIHLIHPAMAQITDSDNPTREEISYVELRAHEDEIDGGYSAIQITRPDTIAASLIDSPAGLAAWIIDKYRAWSDCQGDLSSRFSFDTLLTIITLYWMTKCIGTSFKTYYDYKDNPSLPSIDVPTGITLSTEDRTYPRELADRTYTDIRHWSNPGTGGHFFPMEEPAILASELRQFFRSLR